MPRRASRRPTIDARISAGGGYGQSADVMPPTPVVVGALGGVGKTALGKPQQCAPVLVDQVDLDEARSWRNRFIPLPTEAIGEPMDRHDFAERPARCAGRVAADASDRMRLCGRFGAHPAQDFFGSVRKAKTVAGGDAIWVSRRTTPCSIGVAPAGCARRSICQRPTRIGCGAGEARRGRCQTQFNLFGTSRRRGRTTGFRLKIFLTRCRSARCRFVFDLMRHPGRSGYRESGRWNGDTE